jgi:hypothetical protein
MANSSTNVVVAAPITGGGALVAPIGTTLPTAIATALDADFEALGYLSDDGVNESTDRSSKKQYAWGGDTIATTQDSYGKSFKLTIAEYLNATAKSVVKGASNVTVTAATSTTGTRITSKDTSAQLPLNSWVFDIVSGTARIRKVIPAGRISDLGDIDFKSTDISGQEITIDAYPDATGVYMYEYTDDGIFTV